MAIYTKKGDFGETGVLFSRISKDSLRIKAIGALDEANSVLGLTSTVAEDKKTFTRIKEIQGNLFRIGSILAGSKLSFSPQKTKKLEKEIDKIEGTLPVLRNFILPGGAPLAACLHFARTTVRRAEREVVSLNNKEKLNPQILIYLNRLSDFLFMLARKVNFENNVQETVWNPQKKTPLKKK